jgi:hypothetical protein
VRYFGGVGIICKKMGTKQLASSERQHTCTLAVGGQKATWRAQCDDKHSLYSMDLSLPYFFLFLRLKSVLKGQTFRRCGESHCKSDKSQDIGIKNASKIFTNIEKSMSLPKVTSLKEMLCK